MPDLPDWLPGPIALAPMAGGPSAPELVSAVSGAGALGFLAAGNTTPDALARKPAAVCMRAPRTSG
ncbi:nitronate monooxygenase [Nostocoides vanveenii]